MPLKNLLYNQSMFMYNGTNQSDGSSQEKSRKMVKRIAGFAV